MISDRVPVPVPGPIPVPKPDSGFRPIPVLVPDIRLDSSSIFSDRETRNGGFNWPNQTG
jgi:hypothetical protein